MDPGNKPKIDWQDLERLVRQIASLKYNAPATSETIAGVKCDCVLRPEPGLAVVIEITKQENINKLRDDILKLKTIRGELIQKEIFPRCYFVMLKDPTDALISAGQSAHVSVFGLEQFIDHLHGDVNYYAARIRHPFGSAIDLKSGNPDSSKYVKVNYVDENGDKYDIKAICDELAKGKTVLLYGEYGSGKSRCVQEIFHDFMNHRMQYRRYPMAINLRENWGLHTSAEILTRHFTNLGFGDKLSDLMKIVWNPSMVFLLDGFDEIGSQAWSTDPDKLIEIRKSSLKGVYDIIKNSKGGVLITGREHYFNDDVEMILCLGLDKKDFKILRCNQEFSNAEFAEYSGFLESEIPDWVPKRPLIGSVLKDLKKEKIEEVFKSSSDQVDFWDMLLDTICSREEFIHESLDADIIRQLYIRLARLSRLTATPMGPFSIKKINDAFEAITKKAPTDESAIILHRLPGLGRTENESTERSFVDTFILEGLKAQDVLAVHNTEDQTALEQEWLHPIDDFGIYYLASSIERIRGESSYIAFLKRNVSCKNPVLLSDIFSSLSFIPDSKFDFGNILFSNGIFTYVDTSRSEISGIKLNGCMFGRLDISDSKWKSVAISSSCVYELEGVSDKSALPAWVTDTAVQSFQSVRTLAEIKASKLSLPQKFLLTSLKKLFFQPGAGRRETSMYKGYDDHISKKMCEKVIAILVREKFCTNHRGSHGNLFLPNRSQTARAKAIIQKMSHSTDEVWTQVSIIH